MTFYQQSGRRNDWVCGDIDDVDDVDDDDDDDGAAAATAAYDDYDDDEDDDGDSENINFQFHFFPGLFIVLKKI